MNEDKEDTIAAFKEDFAFLIEAGFVACKQLDEIGATRIFQAAQILSPSNTNPKIGLGFIALNKLDLKQATQLFEEVIAQENDNYLAQTFLGIALLLSKGKQQKGETLIRQAMEASSDPTIKNLGTLALEWSTKELSKKMGTSLFATSGQAEKEEKAEEKTEEKKVENS